jgi:uncharacterized protein DUF4129
VSALVTRAGAVDPDAARRDAKAILDQRRFRPTRVPRPFAGVLRWMGRQLEPVGRFFHPVWDFFNTRVGIAVLVVLVVASAVGIALLIASRRGAGAPSVSGRRASRGRPEDPDALDRAADDAERGGDYDTAVRLRFRAGLLRLDALGAIRLAPSLTAGQAARRLHLDDFDVLARDFDAVAYGARHVDVDAARAARTGWSRVLDEVTTR